MVGAAGEARPGVVGTESEVHLQTDGADLQIDGAHLQIDAAHLQVGAHDRKVGGRYAGPGNRGSVRRATDLGRVGLGGRFELSEFLCI